MPEGMLLKSYPWASNLAEPKSEFSVKRFCTDNMLPYHDSFHPLAVETFISYGKAFQNRYVPDVENRRVTTLTPTGSAIDVGFEDGETVRASRVVVAVGMTPFGVQPTIADSIPSEFVSHSSAYGAFDSLAGKEVAIVGSGSSATDLAAFLHEQGVSVSLVARQPELIFAGTPRPRSLLQRAIGPTSGIGNGWTMGVCATAPWAIHMLPSKVRIQLANAQALGPLGGAFMRDRVIGQVPLHLGSNLTELKMRGDRVELSLGSARNSLRFDHVIFATGYRTNVDRLPFLTPEDRKVIRRTGDAPALSRHYESSIPGLHFVGPAAANSFGPVSRFVYGTPHPARHLTNYFASVLPHRQVTVNHPQGIEVAAVR